MPLLYPILVVVAVIVTHFVVDYVTTRNAQRQLEEIDKWPTLPIESRMLAHTDFTRQFVKDDANRRRNAITFAVGVTAGGALLFGWLDENTEQLQESNAELAVIAETNRMNGERMCAAFEGFVQLLDVRVTEEIRVQQAERDELAASISAAPTSFQAVEGFLALPPEVRSFLDAFVRSEIAESQGDLAEKDTALQGLRGYVDDVRQFGRDLDCPSS